MTATTQLAPVEPLFPSVGTAPSLERQPQRFLGHWPELLWDLSCLEPVRIETVGPGVLLSQSISLESLRLREHMAVLDTDDARLLCVLDAWHGLRPWPGGSDSDAAGFDIVGGGGSTLLRLSTDARTHPVALRTLLGVYRAPDGGVMPFGRRAASSARLDRRLEHLADFGAEQHASLDTADVAEACGWLSLSPARMRRFGRVRRAAAELAPCFFEALADQALKLRVLCGSAGVAHCVQGCVDLYRSGKDDAVLMSLSCGRASLSIDSGQIDSAWVLERPGRAGPRRQLRLYDEHGRLMLLLENLPTGASRDGDIWRALVQALFD